jgi:UDP-N-acetylmuramate dehydrogenase
MKENVLISGLTTMRLGGPARYVKEISELRQIPEIFEFAKTEGLPVFILGGGSNVIGRDEGYEGVIIVNKLRGIQILREVAGEVIIKGYGGEILDDFIEFGVKRGYSGMEAMGAIPGTLGAAPVQNVGAYGQEISQVLQWVEAYDRKTESVVKITTDKMKLGYRRSIFNFGADAGRYFIISVVVKLSKTSLRPPFYTSLQAYVDEHKVTDFLPASIRRMITEIRATKMPDPKEIASSGSFFKNVIIDDKDVEAAKERGIQVWQEGGRNVVNSGWLIEQAGLKGREFFGMRVWDKAALILVNIDARSYANLARAREHIVGIIREDYGFTLEQEPIEIV